jgi:nucleotide-binding universal stress UspA family protein
VEFAIGVARQRAADVRAVQVVPRAPGRSNEPDDPAVRSTLRALRRAGEREGVRVRQVTLTGTPERVIPAYAQLTEAEVIVVGRNYGTSPIWRNSSVVRRLSRSSSVPVIVVPRQYAATSAAPPPLKRVMAAVDFTVASAVALRTAVELATRHGARLTVFHAMGFPQHLAFSAGEVSRLVQDLPIEARRLGERLKERAAAFGAVDVEPLVVTGEASGSIASHASARDADLIVMGVAPRHWLDEVVFGSTLGAVLRKARTPVMVLPVIAGAHQWSDNFKGEWPSRAGAGVPAAPVAA